MTRPTPITSFLGASEAGVGASALDAAPVDPAAVEQAMLAPLVARMGAGDEAALAAFYDAAASKVHGYVLRVCRAPALAEEITEDVFFQVWTQALRYDASRARVMTWLFTIARSRTIDALRARDKAELHAAPETLVDESDGSPVQGIDALLETAQTNARLGALLGRLQPRERQLIALAFYRGLTHAEIAAHIGAPLGTVKTSIRRALATLRDALADLATN